jgi:sec-independent protein translocase protein TatB
MPWNLGKECRAEGDTRLVKTVSRDDCRFSGCGSMMNLMSFSETIFLFLLALIIFGPKKLPEIARQAGKWMNEFRRASNEFKAQIEQEISHLDAEDRRRKALPASPAPEGTASRTLSVGPAGPSDVGSAEASSSDIGSPSSSTTTSVSGEDEPLFAANTADAAPDTSAVNGSADPAPNAIPARSAQESHV